ncbi:hypothetical protein RN01_29295 [Cupriavidus sp. SHE]|jgi:hypothetical protein|uniref:hypothetical protein n=1 Tax=Cupriavidus TaxID=106589 RepID=UPI00046B70B4|nr:MULTISPECIES: hypothetical protein [Cupriavidus]KWR75600.1 hypothetical protein RN01_29295 [Cupriavidus sp. SHE]
MSNLHPIFQTALRGIAPPQLPAGVRSRVIRCDSTHEIEYRGLNREAVQQAAQRRASGIDAYRSPAVSTSRLDGNEWVTTLRYYTVD